jgi:hypothetical protein
MIVTIYCHLRIILMLSFGEGFITGLSNSMCSSF